MVVNNLGPHGVQQLVETFCRKALEEGIRIALGTHAVHNFAAIVHIGIYHGVHGVDIVLTVAVNGDGDIALVLGFHQTGQHCVLVTAVAALADADVVLVALGQVADDGPGFVLGAIVDKQHAAVIADFTGGN